MRSGFDQDDVYVMVEDELLSIAKAFTQHLHHAEYVRMKEAAKRRNKAAGDGVSRPVDTRTAMSEQLKKRKAADAKRKTQQKALDAVMKGTEGDPTAKNAGNEEDDPKDDPWMGTTLQDLMSRGVKKQPSLSRLAGVESGSRARSGFARAEPSGSSAQPLHREQSASRLSQQTGRAQSAIWDDDTTASEIGDDLDMPLNVPATRTARGASNIRAKLHLAHQGHKGEDSESHRTVTHRANRTTTNILEEATGGTSLARQTPGSPTGTQQLSTEPEKPSAIAAFEDGIYEPSTLRSTRGRRAARRTAHEQQEKIKQEENTQPKSARLSEIPIFLV